MADRRNEGRFRYLDDVLGAGAADGGAPGAGDEARAAELSGDDDVSADARSETAEGGEGAAGD